MKKNIIILHTDQQRFDSLGCNGNSSARTEHIDALASEGCNFSRHITANSVCMPSRASLMTGLYVPGHGVSSNGIPLWRRDNGCEDKHNSTFKRIFGVSVKDKIPTMADIMGENGYRTALFGKIHLEPHLSDRSYDFFESYSRWEEEDAVTDAKPYYGFQTRKLILGHGEQPCGFNRGHYGRWLHKNFPDVIDKVFPGEDANTKDGSISNDIYMSNLTPEQHNSMWLADEVAQYLEKNKDSDEPTFMFVGYPDPHHPFTPPKEIAKEFVDIPLPGFSDKKNIVGGKPQAVADAMNSFSVESDDLTKAYRYTSASVHPIDKSVGIIVDKLKQLGIYDDTIIIFTSDHGDFLGDLDMICKTDLAFHNLLHVPFILKPAADHVEIPKKIDTAMSNVDVLPTLLSMVGIKPDDYLQGIDILSPKAKHNTPMATCFSASGKNRNITLYDDNYRYTYYLDSEEEELYDHRTDYQELINLATNATPEMRSLCEKFKSSVLKKHVESDNGLFNHYSLW